MILLAAWEDNRVSTEGHWFGGKSVGDGQEQGLQNKEYGLRLCCVPGKDRGGVLWEC